MKLETANRGDRERWVALALALAVLAPVGAGQGKGKGGGGGKGEEPPPDPAIVYVEGSSGGSTCDLVVMNADGSNRTVVLQGLHVDVRPSFSADGTEIVFADEIGGWGGVWAIGVDGHGLRFIAPMTYSTPALFGNPRWSPVPAPDGSEKIVFGDKDNTPGTHTDLFLVNPDGSGLVQITNTPDIIEFYPSWSPAADRIAYSERDYGNGPKRVGLCALDLGVAGNGQIQVTGKVSLTNVPGSPLEDLGAGATNDLAFYFSAWAYQNPWVVVSAGGASIGGGRYLWLIDLDMPELAMRITNSSKAEWYPSFAPDDASIVYYSTEKKLGIAEVSISGTNVTSVSKQGKWPFRRSF